MEPVSLARTLPPASLAPDLRLAIRRARLEEAERSSVVSELRSSEIARLEMLQAQLQPIFAQVPAGVDIFDCGLSPGDRPRLFIDMVAHVEMAHDRKTYRFMKDTREGRVTLAESADAQSIIEAVTTYVARRIVEREKALAVDTPISIEAAAKAANGAAEAKPAQSALGEFVFTFLVGLISGAAILYALFKLNLLV